MTVVVILGIIYANLQPRYRLADQVPDREQAVSASNRLDAKLTGAQPIDVLIQFPKGESLYSPQTLQTIADVHNVVERQAGVGNVLSVETLRRWLAEKAGKHDVATLKQYVDVLPAFLTLRFVSENQDAVLVSGRVPDVDANDLLPIVQSLDKTLNDVRAKHPGYEIAVTGLSVIAARNSADMRMRLAGLRQRTRDQLARRIEAVPGGCADVVDRCKRREFLRADATRQVCVDALAAQPHLKRRQSRGDDRGGTHRDSRVADRVIGCAIHHHRHHHDRDHEIAPRPELQEGRAGARMSDGLLSLPTGKPPGYAAKASRARLTGRSATASISGSARRAGAMSARFSRQPMRRSKNSI